MNLPRINDRGQGKNWKTLLEATEIRDGGGWGQGGSPGYGE